MDAPAFHHRFTSAFTPRDKLIKRTSFARPATARVHAAAASHGDTPALTLQPVPPPVARRPDSSVSFARPFSSASSREQSSPPNAAAKIPAIPEVLVTFGDEIGRTVQSTSPAAHAEPIAAAPPAFYRPLTAPIKSRAWEPLHSSTSSNDGMLSRLKTAIENATNATLKPSNQPNPTSTPRVNSEHAENNRSESRALRSGNQSQQSDRVASSLSVRRPPSVPALAIAAIKNDTANSASHRHASGRPATSSSRSSSRFNTTSGHASGSALSPRLQTPSTPEALRMHGAAQSHAPRATLADLTQQPSQFKPALALKSAPNIKPVQGPKHSDFDLVSAALRSHSATRQYFADAQSAIGSDPSSPRALSRLSLSRLSMSASPPLTARPGTARPFSPDERLQTTAQTDLSGPNDVADSQAASLKSVIESASSSLSIKRLHAAALVRDIKTLSAILPDSHQSSFHRIESLVSELAILNDEEERLEESLASIDNDIESSSHTCDAAGTRLQTLRRRAADVERAADRLDSIITEKTKKASASVTAQLYDPSSAGSSAGAGTVNDPEHEIVLARALPPRLMSWPLVRPQTAANASERSNSNQTAESNIGSLSFDSPPELQRLEFIQELEILNNRPASPQSSPLHSPKSKLTESTFNRRSALSFIQTSFESMARVFSGASHLSSGPVSICSIVEALIHSCDAERANLYVFDSSNNRLTLKAIAGINIIAVFPNIQTPLHLSASSPSPAARVLRSALVSSTMPAVFRHPPVNPAAAAQTLITERTKHDSYDGQLDFQTQTALALPVYDQRYRVIGVIEVLNKRVTGHKAGKIAYGSPFSRGDESLLALAAAQASCVLQENRARSTLQYLKQQSELISHLHHILRTQTNLAHALSEVCEWLCVATQSQRCAMFVIDHATDSLVLQHFSEWRDCTNSLRLRIDGLNGILSRMLQSNISHNSGASGFVTRGMILLANVEQMQTDRSLRPEIANQATRLLDEGEVIVTTMVVPIRQEATGALLGIAQLFNCATRQHDSVSDIPLNHGIRSYDHLDVDAAVFWSAYAAIVTEHSLLLERQLATRARLATALESVGSRLNSIDLNSNDSSSNL